MKRVTRVITIVGVALVGLFVGVVFVKLPNVHNSQNVKNTGNTVIAMSDICDCYLVTGSLGVNRVIDIRSGQAVQNPLFQSVSGYGDTVISPDGSLAAATYRDSTEVVVSLLPNASPTSIYTAPKGKLIAGLTWADDTSALVIGLENTDTLPATEGTWPISLVMYDVATKTISPLTTIQDVHRATATALYPIAVDTLAKEMVVSVAFGKEGSSVYMWRKDGNRFITFDGLNDGESWTTSFSAGTAFYFRKTFDTINRVNLTSEMLEPYILPNWVGGPFLAVSPDGDSLVYLERAPNATQGYLTLFHFSSQTTTRLSNEVFSSDSLVNNAVIWTPDNKYVIYGTTGTSGDEFYALSSVLENQVPKRVTISGLHNDDSLWKLIARVR